MGSVVRSRHGLVEVVDVDHAYWRIGRKLGRTIYAMVDLEPSDDDVFLGIMDSRAIAARVVTDHNGMLDLMARQDA